MNKIRVLLVDDQNLVREGLKSLIQISGTMDVVAEADDGDVVISELHQHEPDVLLLDIRMPRMSGLEVLKQMQQQRIHTPCLILTTFDDHDLVLECIQFGAKGYLRKDVRFDTLKSAITSLAHGDTWYQPSAICHLEHVQKDVSSQPNERIPQLTSRETQVLRLVAAGYSNVEIATALCKSKGTVRNQVSAVLAKLNVRDRTQAVIKALEHKII